VPIVGLQVMPIDEATLIAHLHHNVETGHRDWVVTLNLDHVARSGREPSYRKALEGATLIVADGAPIVWAVKKKRPDLASLDRVTGADATLHLLQSLPPGQVAIIGGKDPKLALQKLDLDPGAGWLIFDGVISLEDQAVCDLAEAIKGRRFAFVALGVPKQEYLIEKLWPLCPETTFIGVGGSFEFIAGLTQRAPIWMQKRGLEWLHRLVSEPKRLWRRYLVEYIPGAIALRKDVKRG
jgi:N-acetylglucosaminyldiphosphoundecaprenol N-acetyl-beta-D-mannosaminyltransferase